MASCGECCRGCLSNAVIGTCASLYLIIGIAIAGAGMGTFFTAVGQVIDPIYASMLLGGGIVIFVVGCVGLCAACENKQRVITLYLFMFLTLAMVAASIGLTILLFQYEELLMLTTAAAGNHAAGTVANATELAGTAIGAAGTTVIKTLATNAFYACGAKVNATSVASVYTFECSNDEFNMLQATINNTCMDTTAYNATFSNCYAGGSFPQWTGVDPFGVAVNLTSTTALATLNTPKGLFCACSSTIIDTYILPYLSWVKWLPIAVALFFCAVFVACCHQLYQRGCCGGKGLTDKRERELQPDAIQMTYPDQRREPPAAKGKGKKGSGSSGYIARP